MKKGHLFVVSAPSGAGKTTIVARVLKKLTGLKRSVSATTRDPRKGEKDKKDYFFFSKELFRKKVKEDHFLEWEDNFGELYGTPKKTVTDSLKKGIDVILTIDVKGAMQVKRNMPQTVLLFVVPPSMRELSKRIKTRATDSNATIAKRLALAKKEMTCMKKYDYCIVNDDLKKAVSNVIAIIEAKRCEI